MMHLRWIGIGLGLLCLACGSEDSGGQAQSGETLDALSLSGLNESDGVDEDTLDGSPSDDVEGESTDGSDGADSEPSPWECPESLGTQPAGVSGMVYSCLSIAEGLPYQVIRQGRFETGEVVTRAEVFAPNEAPSLQGMDGPISIPLRWKTIWSPAAVFIDFPWREET